MLGLTTAYEKTNESSIFSTAFLNPHLEFLKSTCENAPSTAGEGRPPNLLFPRAA